MTFGDIWSSSSKHLRRPGFEWTGSSITTMAPLTLGLLIAALVAVLYRRRRSILERDFPVLNKLPSEYYRDAEGLVSKGFEEHGGRPFRVDSGLAKWIILPGETADEIRNHEDLDSAKKSQEVFSWLHPQAAFPGFDPFAIFSSQLMHDVTKCITRNLGKQAHLTCSLVVLTTGGQPQSMSHCQARQASPCTTS